MPTSLGSEEAKDPNLDRGWAWVISVAVCVINIITLGSIRCMGILVSHASIEFSVNKRDSSLIFSVTYVTFMLSSSLFIALTQVVSCRILIFIGGLLTSLGLCLAFFLPTPPALASGTAVLLGLGLSAGHNPSILLLNQYFDRYRSRANGIAFAGGPIGAFLMPPLLTHLMLQYTFRGGMLLWGGLTLHVCAAACLMRPKPSAASQLNGVTLKRSTLFQGPAYGEGLVDDPAVPYAEEDAETVDGEEEQPLPDAVELPLTTMDQQNQKAKATVGDSKIGSSLIAMCGLHASLFRRLEFYTLGAVVTLGLCGLTLSFYIVPLHGREIGLSSTTTSLFLLLQGVPDLLSRLLAGFLTDKKLLSHLRLVWLALLAQSLLWFVLLATPSYGGLLFFATSCGLVGGIVAGATHPLAISLLGFDNYRAAFAIYSVLHGCWMLCLPILLGHIYDKTDSWRLAIMFVAFLLTTAGITGLLMDLSQSLRALTHRAVRRMWRP